MSANKSDEAPSGGEPDVAVLLTGTAGTYASHLFLRLHPDGRFRRFPGGNGNAFSGLGLKRGWRNEGDGDAPRLLEIYVAFALSTGLMIPV